MTACRERIRISASAADGLCDFYFAVFTGKSVFCLTFFVIFCIVIKI